MTNTIRDDAQFNRILPFREMKPLFVRNIQPQDVDAEVELNSNFLWQEWKTCNPGLSISDAQLSACLRRVWFMGERGAVIFVWHRKMLDHEREIKLEDVRFIQVALRCRWLANHMDIVRVTRPIPTNEPDDLLYYVGQWSLHAQERPNMWMQDFMANSPHVGYKCDSKTKFITKV